MLYVYTFTFKCVTINVRMFYTPLDWKSVEIYRIFMLLIPRDFVHFFFVSKEGNPLIHEFKKIEKLLF